MESEIFYNNDTQNEFYVKFRVDSQFDDVASFKAKNFGQFFKTNLLTPLDAQKYPLSELKNFECFIKLNQKTYVPKYSQQITKNNFSKFSPTFYDLILQIDFVFRLSYRTLTDQEEKKDLDIWLLQSDNPVFLFYIQKKKQSSLDLYLITMLSQQSFKDQQQKSQ